jgi:hypothetical protein
VKVDWNGLRRRCRHAWIGIGERFVNWRAGTGMRDRVRGSGVEARVGANEEGFSADMDGGMSCHVLHVGGLGRKEGGTPICAIRLGGVIHWFLLPPSQIT